VAQGRNPDREQSRVPRHSDGKNSRSVTFNSFCRSGRAVAGSEQETGVQKRGLSRRAGFTVWPREAMVLRIAPGKGLFLVRVGTRQKNHTRCGALQVASPRQTVQRGTIRFEENSLAGPQRATAAGHHRDEAIPIGKGAQGASSASRACSATTRARNRRWRTEGSTWTSAPARSARAWIRSLRAEWP